MPNKKHFLKLSASLAFGSILFFRNTKAFYSNPPLPAVDLQLFTLFNVMDDALRQHQLPE
jgi:hypothetical protein